MLIVKLFKLQSGNFKPYLIIHKASLVKPLPCILQKGNLLTTHVIIYKSVYGSSSVQESWRTTLKWFCKKINQQAKLTGKQKEGLFGFKEVGGSEEVGKCHFPLPLSIQTPEKENEKTFFPFLFSLLHNHFLASRVLQLVLWSCKSHL